MTFTPSSPSVRRVLIVGGVAGGASCAARLRRLDESAEIIVFDRGPHVSFANCGLPYHVGDVIADEQRLLLASPELFRERFNIEVHTETEALAIDREARTLRVCDLRHGTERVEPYDVLVLAPGAAPIRPPLRGIDRPGIFVVRSIPDTRRIRAFLDEAAAAYPGRELTAQVVGGGFIGLEMAENLLHRGLRVGLIEKADQVMPPLDPEMAASLAEHLRASGVSLHLGDGLRGFVASGDREGPATVVETESGARLPADLVILALGVRPETGLARAAGLTLGARGGTLVDAQMRTSDPHIWAVGDAVEVHDRVLGQETVLPLAGPANRQGRVAAASIAGRPVSFGGVQATAVVGALGMTAACTGASEKGLRRAGVTDFEVVYLHPGHHAGYYPGARPIHMKLLFARDGRVLGAQAVGGDGTDKRVDVIATVIQRGGTVYDLAEAELCYAPQYGAAKDPVNVAGMIAVNVLAGDLTLADWTALDPARVLDVREPEEFAAGHVPGSRNIPLSVLRERHGELAREVEHQVICGVGQRAYYACRFLAQHGYQVRHLSGGYATYQQRRAAGLIEAHAR